MASEVTATRSSAHRHFWSPVAERFDAAVLLYDCTGHGESAKAPRSYSVEGFADDLARLWPARRWAAAALAFAARYAKRVSALGLVDTTAWYGPDAPRQWEERAHKAHAGSASDVQAYAASCRILDADDLRAALPAIEVPAAVIVGEEDYATPRRLPRSWESCSNEGVDP